jgi:hypothetical protein
MQHAQLVSHVDTDVVSRTELRALPDPEATRTFKPIPHVELVDMLETVPTAAPRSGFVPPTTRPCPSSFARVSPSLSATISPSAAT